jgi:hypothetical protein
LMQLDLEPGRPGLRLLCSVAMLIGSKYGYSNLLCASVLSSPTK